jgi:HemY protein
MRAALWFLALFALAVAFTLLARIDQGYVIVVYPPWRMELSFMLAILLLAGVGILVYGVLRLAAVALNLSGDMRAWNARRRKHKADKALLDAVRAYLDGDVKSAAALAAKAANSTLAPDIALRLQEPALAAVKNELKSDPISRVVIR